MLRMCLQVLALTCTPPHVGARADTPLWSDLVTTPLTSTTRIIVRCVDGAIRHLDDSTVPGGSFTTLAGARIWADMGHCCTNVHTFETVETNGSEGCIVLSGIDGPSLWDCECTSCVSIQDEYYASEGPTCSICDAVGHGYPGGPPCPLEVTDYSGEPWWAL
jgi:hypothetical protein